MHITILLICTCTFRNIMKKHKSIGICQQTCTPETDAICCFFSLKFSNPLTNCKYRIHITLKSILCVYIYHFTNRRISFIYKLHFNKIQYCTWNMFWQKSYLKVFHVLVQKLLCPHTKTGTSNDVLNMIKNITCM